MIQYRMPTYSELLLAKFYNDFQNFIFSNSILIAASGFTIGVATSNLIIDNMKIFSPISDIVYKQLVVYDTFLFGVSKNSIFASIIYSILLFIANIGTWLITIVFTFVLLEYILNNKFLGLKSTVREEDEKTFMISKIAAKKEEIIPTGENLKKMELKQKTDEIIGEKIIENMEKEVLQDTVAIINEHEKIDSFGNYMLLN